MTLGERCDEIVRLIDATLESCAMGTPAPSELAPATRSGDPAETPVLTRVRALAQAKRESLARSA